VDAERILFVKGSMVKKMCIHKSRTILVFSLLLTVFLAGCGNGNPARVNTMTTQEAPGLSPTRGPTDTLTPSRTTPPTPIPSPGFTLTSSLTPTSQPMPTASPTPIYAFDLARFDPDLYQPIDVSHNPPLIARSGDTVQLVFDFANLICMAFPVSCMPDGVLYYSYGDNQAFQSMQLTIEMVNEMESLVARLPAADQEGGSLRYYAEFSVPEAGYTQRFPGAGTIDLFTTDDFIDVELPIENEVKPGEEVYDFFWGYGPDKVRQATYEGYPQRVGPPAMDVADDGRIALLDPVNERIIIFNPGEDSYSSLPMPFPYGFLADLAFDQEGRLMVCDFQGEEDPGAFLPVPYCYLLLPDGDLVESTPVYVKSPSKITQDLKILDYFDSRLVAPFNSQGQANSREVQRQKETWEFPKRYAEGQDPYVAHYADMMTGVVFEVHAVSPLGVLTEFEKTPQGYLMTFSIGDRIRAVWIDLAGNVVKDVTLPNDQYSEINFNGQVAITQAGSLYVLSSTERGIEVHFVGFIVSYCSIF
jgi:hypothetical protein